jgi:hypothetical protein
MVNGCFCVLGAIMFAFRLPLLGKAAATILVDRGAMERGEPVIER